MGPHDVRAGLRGYADEIRALIADVERDRRAGASLSPPVRARLQAFTERLNDELLRLYARQQHPGLSEAESAVLLPVVARLRHLMRGVGTVRDAEGAMQRLRNAAAGDWCA